MPDDNHSLEVLSTFFHVCGAQLLISRSTAGLAHLDTASKLDGIVTDLEIPYMDGIDYARRVRRHRIRNNVPSLRDGVPRSLPECARVRCVVQKAG
jgi:CheY-like chemotaxis protein